MLLSSSVIAADLLKPNFSLVNELVEISVNNVSRFDQLVEAFILGRNETENVEEEKSLELQSTTQEEESSVVIENSMMPALKRTRVDSETLADGDGALTSCSSETLKVTGEQSVAESKSEEEYSKTLVDSYNPDVSGTASSLSKTIESDHLKKEMKGRSSVLSVMSNTNKSASATSLPLNTPLLIDLDDWSNLNTGVSKDKFVDLLLTNYRTRPTLLFSAPHKEPLLSGFGNLDATLLGKLL
jgi:hypothetical protein